MSKQRFSSKLPRNSSSYESQALKSRHRNVSSNAISGYPIVGSISTSTINRYSNIVFFDDDIYIYSEGTILCKGSFSRGITETVNVNTSPIKILKFSTDKILVLGLLSISMYNFDLSLDSDFTQGNFNNSCYDMDVDLTTEKIYVCGEFSTYNGLAADRVIRLNADGSRDTSFSVSLNSAPSRVRVDQLNQNVYLTGRFTTVNSVTRVAMAKLSPLGVLDTSFKANPGDSATPWITYDLLIRDSDIIFTQGYNVRGALTDAAPSLILYYVEFNKNSNIRHCLSPIISIDKNTGVYIKHCDIEIEDVTMLADVNLPFFGIFYSASPKLSTLPDGSILYYNFYSTVVSPKAVGKRFPFAVRIKSDLEIDTEFNLSEGLSGLRAHNSTFQSSIFPSFSVALHPNKNVAVAVGTMFLNNTRPNKKSSQIAYFSVPSSVPTIPTPEYGRPISGWDSEYFFSSSGINYRILAFFKPNRWRVFTIEPSSDYVKFDVLLVGGGGGAAGKSAFGNYHASGGGGAGGVVYREVSISPHTTKIPVFVGNGGLGGVGGGSTDIENGIHPQIGGTTFFGGIRAYGGGGSTGVTHVTGTFFAQDWIAASGGGCAADYFWPYTSSSIYGQGNSGGPPTVDSFTRGRASAGGGGAGQPGFPATGTVSPVFGGNGGIGLDFSEMFGTRYGEQGWFGGGGGGGAFQTNIPGTGGRGGGGNGAAAATPVAPHGLPTTGGGGGGSGGQATLVPNTGGSGGSGIVLVRYQI
jgi:hypothetical protein